MSRATTVLAARGWGAAIEVAVDSWCRVGEVAGVDELERLGGRIPRPSLVALALHLVDGGQVVLIEQVTPRLAFVPRPVDLYRTPMGFGATTPSRATMSFVLPKLSI